MRKFLVVPVLAVCLALGLAACSGGSSGSSSKFCTQLKEYRAKGESLFPTGATDSENYQRAITELKKLEKSAPKAIKQDIVTIRQAVEKLQSGDLNALTDPEFSNELQTAARNLEEYSTKVCKIDIPERDEQGGDGGQ